MVFFFFGLWLFFPLIFSPVLYLNSFKGSFEIVKSLTYESFKHKHQFHGIMSKVRQYYRHKITL